MHRRCKLMGQNRSRPFCVQPARLRFPQGRTTSLLAKPQRQPGARIAIQTPKAINPIEKRIRGEGVDASRLAEIRTFKWTRPVSVPGTSRLQSRSAVAKALPRKNPMRSCFALGRSASEERFVAKKKPPGRSPDGLFPQLPAHSRFHRCDFGEADRMLSFQPLIERYAEGASIRPTAPILCVKVLSTTVRQY
jgi:hypothetical protein